MRFERLTTVTFAEAAREDPVVLLPWGIVEEHGPHLPLDTDTVQAEAVCRGAAERAAGDARVLVLPAVPHGNCVSTRNFPGSLSLRFDTVRALALDLLLELRRNGVRRVAVVSGHAGGGHMRALKLAAEEAIERHPDLRVAVLTPWEWGREFGLRWMAEHPDAALPTWDGHAGALETATMLHHVPDAVGAGRAPHRAEFPDPVLVPDPERYFPSGVLGDPTRATPEMGRALAEFFVERLADVVRRLAKA